MRSAHTCLAMLIGVRRMESADDGQGTTVHITLREASGESLSRREADQPHTTGTWHCALRLTMTSRYAHTYLKCGDARRSAFKSDGIAKKAVALVALFTPSGDHETNTI